MQSVYMCMCVCVFPKAILVSWVKILQLDFVLTEQNVGLNYAMLKMKVRLKMVILNRPQIPVRGKPSLQGVVCLNVSPTSRYHTTRDSESRGTKQDNLFFVWKVKCQSYMMLSGWKEEELSSQTHGYSIASVHTLF